MSNCQELVHCDAIYNFGCDGGLVGYAFEFINNNGVALILMKTIPTKEHTANVISTGRMPRLLQLMGMKMSLKMMKKHCRRKLLINPLVFPFKLVAIPSRLINRVLLPEDVEQIWIMVLWRLVMALTTGRTTGS